MSNDFILNGDGAYGANAFTVNVDGRGEFRVGIGDITDGASGLVLNRHHVFNLQ